MERLNERIRAGTARSRAGLAVASPCEGGLVRQDGKVLYPIRQGIPIMLIREAIELES